METLAAGVIGGDRAALGRAITLIESTREADRDRAQELLARLMPHTGNALRVGITGVPGVGKSTFIDALGDRLTGGSAPEGADDRVPGSQRVAVLAVDPSSVLRGGSILGDKTRMARLSIDPNAFIRPSPSSGALGGVASRSRESILLCEAAGYDVVLVETVGVGQSEARVAGMTDCFVALMLPGAGDELQSIKRGLLELTDVIVVNKADGDNEQRAARAAQDFKNALQYLERKDPDWAPPVLTCSALTDNGIDAVWEQVLRHQATLHASGRWERNRSDQRLNWLHERIREGILTAFRDDPGVRKALPEIEAEVRSGSRLPTAAADDLVQRFLR